jgi:hypothetical protein
MGGGACAERLGEWERGTFPPNNIHEQFTISPIVKNRKNRKYYRNTV